MIEANNAAHSAAIAEKAGFLLHPTDITISRSKDGILLGGVVMQKWTGASITIHVAGFDPHWLNRNMLWAVFHYVFMQAGCNIALLEIRSSNQKALVFASKLGFKEVARIHEVYPDADLVVMRMDRAHCRWLGLAPRLFGVRPNGQEVRRAAPA